MTPLKRVLDMGFICKWLKGFFGPRIWAVWDDDLGIWSKVVVYREPQVLYGWWKRGPFRSEMDCEEFCNRQNFARNKMRAMMYRI